MTTTTTTEITSFTTDAAARIRDLAAALNGAFVERSAEIRAALICLVAREHLLLLGDPGTGKSALTNAICTALDFAPEADTTDFFAVLMTRYTVPEEVFGPVSLTGLERDEYRRVTKGFLPRARVAFLDEVFKANSAILNSLLTLVNERVFDNGGERVACPLQLCVGASNELPEDESLAALYDRFVLRRWVSPIANRDALRGLLRSKGEPKIAVRLSSADLDAIRDLADNVEVPDEVLDVLLDLRDALAREHGITASDRRWRKCVKLVRATAAIDGRSVAARTDVMVLADALWRKPEERPAIVATMARIASPDLASALALLDSASELLGRVGDLSKAPVQDARKADGTVEYGLGSTNDALKQILAKAFALAQDGSVAEATTKIQAMQASVARAARTRLGLS